MRLLEPPVSKNVLDVLADNDDNDDDDQRRLVATKSTSTREVSRAPTRSEPSLEESMREVCRAPTRSEPQTMIDEETRMWPSLLKSCVSHFHSTPPIDKLQRVSDGPDERLMQACLVEDKCLAFPLLTPLPNVDPDERRVQAYLVEDQCPALPLQCPHPTLALITIAR